MPASTMDPRRKRLVFRCEHRGTKENDILLGGFARRHAAELSEPQLDRLEALLEVADNDLYNWITGKVPVPDAFDHDVMAWLRKFNNV